MSRVLDAIRTAIDERDALGFVHVGRCRSPATRFLAAALDEPAANATVEQMPTERVRTDPRAYGITPDATLVESSASDHAAQRLVARLGERADTGTLLVPPSIPHDAALHLDSAGFDLASSDALAVARSRKSTAERDAIRSARAAAAAGLRRAATLAADPVDGEPRSDSGPTVGELRREIDAAVVTAGGSPGARTRIVTPEGATRRASGSPPIADASGSAPAASAFDARIESGDPIVVDLTACGRAGYHARLVRTLVPGTDGGWERRAHVAVESALRSARVLLRTDAPSVGDVEAELVAEIGSFGFAGTATGTAVGIGRDPVERPLRPGAEIRPGSVVTLEAGVERDDGAAVRIAEPVVVTEDEVRWVGDPNWSLEPSAYTV
ncbi:M24 family metallopeptidase [Halovivax limisalsi]|uniref:M24 family metallopeptidase n=1 Tax=Halovivax limisalsi TaxID=1453760 RepID=UPI001FFDA0C0|nr:M24 family metallopeptidase [Halovivax limisalsi]